MGYGLISNTRCFVGIFESRQGNFIGMTPQECRAKALEMREYGRNNPQFSESAERIAATWEAAARALEEDESPVSAETLPESNQMARNG